MTEPEAELKLNGAQVDAVFPRDPPGDGRGEHAQRRALGGRSGRRDRQLPSTYQRGQHVPVVAPSVPLRTLDLQFTQDFETPRRAQRWWGRRRRNEAASLRRMLPEEIEAPG